MLQFTCDNFFDLKNHQNKVNLFAKMVAQHIDHFKHNHMMTAQSLINGIKLPLEHFNNVLVGDANLATTSLGQHVNGALNAANLMSVGGVNSDLMQDLKSHLDGIWQIAHPVPPMPDPNNPNPMPIGNPMPDIIGLQSLASPFLMKDCANTDFQMLASDLSMIYNHPMCHVPFDPMNPMSTIMNPWSLDNFELFEKCSNIHDFATLLGSTVTPPPYY